MNEISYIETYDNGEASIYDLETIDAHANTGKVLMRYSPLDNAWTSLVKGEVAVKLKDTGDEVKIKFDNGKKIKLDYSQLQELAMILQYYNEDSGLVNLKPTIKKMKEVEL
jgi:argininosuccinate synthase